MFGTCNDGILNLGSQLVKECAVTGNTNHQTLVVFGVFLSVTQGVGRNDVEISVDDLLPENFNSAEDILAMIKEKMS